jgi:hypothetical protein
MIGRSGDRSTDDTDRKNDKFSEEIVLGVGFDLTYVSS